MNIFFLHKCPKLAAKMQVDKSRVKMCLETAQLLSTALRLSGCNEDFLYKPNHVNHPSSLWARRSRKNFLWLAAHGIALCEGYTTKFNKVHKSQAVIEKCIEFAHLIPEGSLKLTIDDLAIKSTPEGIEAFNKYAKSKRTTDDAIEAYRSFYFSKDYVVAALTATPQAK